MPSPSYWEIITPDPPADIAIIGGGFTGLNMALECRARQPNASIIVLERAAHALGASTRNAGFACLGSPTELLADLKTNGEESTVDTVKSRLEGIRRLERDWAAADIGYARHGGYEVITDSRTAANVAANLPRLNALLAPLTGLAETWRPTAPPAGAPRGVQYYYNSLEFQLNPAALHRAMRRRCRELDIQILSGVEIVDFRADDRGYDLITAGGTTQRARMVGVCTNAFIPRLLPQYGAPRIRPVRNQVLVTRQLPGLQLRGCWHFHEGYVYFRNIGSDRLLIGGARHQAGPVSETDNFGGNEKLENHLIDWIAGRLPELSLTSEDFPHRWSGILAQGAAKGVVLEKVSEGMVVAGRLAGMGVALSHALGRKAAAHLLP